MNSGLSLPYTAWLSSSGCRDRWGRGFLFFLLLSVAVCCLAVPTGVGRGLNAIPNPCGRVEEQLVANLDADGRPVAACTDAACELRRVLENTHQMRRSLFRVPPGLLRECFDAWNFNGLNSAPQQTAASMISSFSAVLRAALSVRAGPAADPQCIDGGNGIGQEDCPRV